MSFLDAAGKRSTATPRPTRKPEQLVQTKVRIPERLRRIIERRAKKNGRPFSVEVVSMLGAADRADGLERAIETTTLRTILSVVRELQANPERGALIAGAMERRLVEAAGQQMTLFGEAAR
jgi:hypothetical protein